MRFFSIILAFLLLPLASNAQMRGGFKTGLNLSSFKGPVLSGGATESSGYVTGFHVGPVVQWPITKSVGVKVELLYNQAGGEYHFDGDGFTILSAEDDTKILAIGKKKIDLAITNTYLDLPVLGYVRVGSFLFEGGVTIGALIQSTATGQLVFSGASEASGTEIEEFKQELFYNYLKDEAGEANSEVLKEITLDGKIIRIPKRIGAYYLEKEKARLFNTLDMGLSVGMSYFVGSSLYIGGRLNVGLSDITNNDVDFDRVKTEGLDLIRNADKDKNFQIQFTVGFRL